MDKGRLIRKTPVVCDGMNKIFTLAAAFATAIATAFFGRKAQHLISVLKEHYEIEEDWSGSKILDLRRHDAAGHGKASVHLHSKIPQHPKFATTKGTVSE